MGGAGQGNFSETESCASSQQVEFVESYDDDDVGNIDDDDDDDDDDDNDDDDDDDGGGDDDDEGKNDLRVL